MKFRPIAAAIAFAGAFAACSSPEVTRVRGGGPGADVGNRERPIEMHAGSKPYWQTPKIITSRSPPLESAQQARTGEHQ